MSAAGEAARAELRAWLDTVGATERERRAAWSVFESYAGARKRPGWSTIVGYSRTDLQVGRDIAQRWESSRECPNCGRPIYCGQAPASRRWCDCDTFAPVDHPAELVAVNSTAPPTLF